MQQPLSITSNVGGGSSNKDRNGFISDARLLIAIKEVKDVSEDMLSDGSISLLSTEVPGDLHFGTSSGMATYDAKSGLHAEVNDGIILHRLPVWCDKYL